MGEGIGIKRRRTDKGKDLPCIRIHDHNSPPLTAQGILRHALDTSIYELDEWTIDLSRASAINSAMAQEASPIGIGQTELARNQFSAASTVVRTTSPSIFEL